jgi:hypothetical protein
MEQDVFAHIEFENGEIDATSENTSLYTFMGNEAIKNHVWLAIDGEHGARIWEQIPPDNPMYNALAPLVVEGGAELHLNIRTPSPSDSDAFDKAITKDIDNFPDWLPEV